MRGPSRREPNERDRAWARLYQDGLTLAQIGAQYGVTRERVRQLLRKHTDVSAEDGGRYVRRQRLQRAKQAARDAKYLARHGCTFDQWKYLRSLKGARYRAPLGAWRSQANNARARGIAWELGLWEWWTFWQESGRWNERGRGQGYVMCRKNDQGPYALDNVFIALAVENNSNTKNKKSGLPIGVRPAKTPGKFTAQRFINGQRIGLGTHDTPDLAHAAYLSAAPIEQRAA